MKISLWRRLRRRWHMWLHRLSREAAEDLMDGLDLGDHDCSAGGGQPPPESGPPLPDGRRAGLSDGPRRGERLLRGRRFGPRRLDRLDREFQAGGPVADVVTQRLLEDLASPLPDGRRAGPKEPREPKDDVACGPTPHGRPAAGP